MSRILTIAVAVLLVGGFVYSRQIDTPTTVVITDGPSSAWMPIRVLPNGLVLATVRVSGVELPALLDTAAGATLIDQGVAQRIGLPLGQAVTVAGTTGQTRAHFASGVTVDFGTARVGPGRVVVMDLTELSAKLPEPMSMVLGRDLFDQAVVDIDYAGQRMRVHDRAVAVEAAGAVSVRLDVNAAGKYELPATIEGLPPTPLHVDTGSTETLTVFRAFADAHAMLAHRSPISTRLTSGVVGADVSRLATIRRLDIAGLQFSEVPAVFDQAGRGAFGSRTAAGNLGAGVLRRFHVTIDVPHRRLLLRPAPGWDAAFGRDRMGLQVVFRDGGLDVLHVADGSPAAADGWRTGDRIVTVNGVAASLEVWRAWRAMSMGDAGTRVELTDGAGRRRVLTLRDYY